MIMMKVIDSFFAIIIFLIIAITLSLDTPVTLYRENGPVENLQAALLLISSLFFLGAAKNKQQSSRNVVLILSLIFWAYFLREIEIKDIGLAPWVEFLFAGDGRKLLLIPFIVLLFLSAKSTGHYYSNFSHYIKNPMVVCLILALLALIISYPFDKKLIVFGPKNLWEETLELISSIFILMSAYHANSTFAKIEQLSTNATWSESSAPQQSSPL